MSASPDAPAAALDPTAPPRGSWLTRAAGSRLRSLATGYGPPLLVFALAVTQLLIVAHVAGFDPLDSRTWSRWDSLNYLSIAQHGYTPLPPCSVRPVGDFACSSNAGWFPGYPWVTGALARLGLPLGGMAVAVAWLFALATLILLWRTFLGARLTPVALGALAFAAFAPGQVYEYAAFPLSMLAFFTVLHLWLLSRKRWVAAGLAGAVAAFTYPIGAVLVPVAAAWALLAPEAGAWRRRLRGALVAGGLTAAGFAAVLLVMQLQAGAWNAYFQVQGGSFGNDHLVDPFYSLWAIHPVGPAGGLSALVHQPSLDLPGGRASALTFSALQTVLVLVVMAALLSCAALRRRRLSRIDLLLLGWAVAFFAFPLIQPDVGLYRAQAALLPVTVLVRLLPRPVLVVVLVGAVALTGPMARLFLQGTII